jgi:hypothetical protein
MVLAGDGGNDWFDCFAFSKYVGDHRAREAKSLEKLLK